VIFFYLGVKAKKKYRERHDERRQAILGSLPERLKFIGRALHLYCEELALNLDQQATILEGSPFFVAKGEVGPDDATTELTEVVVSKKHEIRVRAATGDTLVYEFSTVGKDIEFALAFEAKGTIEAEVLKEQERVNSNVEAIKDEVVADKDGSFVLKWDNSYSWLSSKTLHYKAYVVPATAGEFEEALEHIEEKKS